MFRIDFGNRNRRSAASIGSRPAYEDFSGTRASGPLSQVADLTQRRDEVMGERLKEIVDLTIRDGHIELIIQLDGPAPDARWLKALTVTIKGGGSTYRCCAPFSASSESETGAFIGLKTVPMHGKLPFPSEISPESVVRIAHPRGWALETRFSELPFFTVMAP